MLKPPAFKEPVARACAAQRRNHEATRGRVSFRSALPTAQVRASRKNHLPGADLDPPVPCEKSRIADLRAFTVLARRRGNGGMNPAQCASRPGTPQVGGGPTEASESGFSRGSSSRYDTLDAQILRTASHWEVWIFHRGKPLRCAGSIGSALVSDAFRHGQDLVDDLLNDTLKQLERSSHLPVCGPADRPDDRWCHPGSISLVPSHDYSSNAARRAVAKSYQRCST